MDTVVSPATPLPDPPRLPTAAERWCDEYTARTIMQRYGVTIPPSLEGAAINSRHLEGADVFTDVIHFADGSTAKRAAGRWRAAC